jgi:hypothetical protein
MELTGFKHTDKTLEKKRQLMEKPVDPDLIEIHSALSRRSRMSRAQRSGERVGFSAGTEGNEDEDDEDEVSIPDSRDMADFDASIKSEEDEVQV